MISWSKCHITIERKLLGSKCNVASFIFDDVEITATAWWQHRTVQNLTRVLLDMMDIKMKDVEPEILLFQIADL